MSQRKKPVGEDLIAFCKDWDEASHAEKQAMCKELGITYDTGKHVRSEADIPKASILVTPKVEDFSEVEGLADTIGEILCLHSKTKLDFCMFDLETSNLKADFSVLLCACIKPYRQPAIVFRADDYPEWKDKRQDDSKIVKAISEELSRHAIIIGHYSSKFDIPYLRAKAVKYHLPPLPPMFGIDTYYIAKGAFCVSSRRLENLTRYFELGKKVGVEGGLWMEAAMSGSRVAMDAIVEHCVADVDILEKLAEVSFPYLRSIKRL